MKIDSQLEPTAKIALQEDIPIKISLFNKLFKWPSIRMLQIYYKNRLFNGYDPAFARHGKLIFIKPRTFFNILEDKKKSCNDL